MSVPELVGRYRVGERIGAGAFGSVWRAHDPELDSDVAVKILAENWVGDDDVMTRFVEEAKVLRRADSDRIVRVYDIGVLDDGRPYFVMSYADRGTLADRLEHATLPVPYALRIAREVARAVAVLHDLDVLHRDIKPSNVLFCSSRNGERMMLADLGLAKAVANASGFTVAAGTPGYMSPEQSTGGSGLDRRVDVYALGALTYVLLTGQRPQTAPGSGQVQPPSALRANLPAGTDELVLRALAPDRTWRWPDATAFADAVDTLMPGHQIASAAPVSSTAPHAPSGGQPNAAGSAGSVSPAGPYQGSPGSVPQTGQPVGQPAVTQAGGLGAGVAGHPSNPPGGQLGAHPRRQPRKRWLIGGVAGVCVLALVVGLGLYAVNQPATLRTSQDQIVVEVPRAWQPDSGEPGESIVDLTTYVYGKAIRLTTQSSPKKSLSKDVGITVVASRAFSDYTSDEIFQYQTPNTWSPGECPAEAVTSKVKTQRFKHATLRQWTLGHCVQSGKAYGEAFLVNKSYGVHLFMVSKNGPKPFRDVLDSVRVKAHSLPG